jgi:hypothetical protein
MSFYKLDLEILFSNDPFLEKEIFNFVRSTRTTCSSTS